LAFIDLCLLRISDMLLRFFTFFLLLTMFFPAGVFGAVEHGCGMDKSAPTMSCCQGFENNRHSVDGVAQLTHHCSQDLAPIAQPSAAVNSKIQIDTAPLAEIGIVSIFFQRLTANPLQTYFIRVMSHPPGEAAPVFLRTCSFLI